MSLKTEISKEVSSSKSIESFLQNVENFFRLKDIQLRKIRAMEIRLVPLVLNKETKDAATRISSLIDDLKKDVTSKKSEEITKEYLDGVENQIQQQVTGAAIAIKTLQEWQEWAQGRPMNRLSAASLEYLLQQDSTRDEKATVDSLTQVLLSQIGRAHV